MFLRQIGKNRVAHLIFTELLTRDNKRSSRESFLIQLKELKSILLDADGNKVDPLNTDKKEVLAIIKARFACNNKGLVDSVRTALYCRDGVVLLRLLLTVGFRGGSPVGSSVVDGVDDSCGDVSTLLGGGMSSIDPG